MSTWYLGPPGDLRPLPVPDKDVRMDLVRYGGVHQALSGARTMDVTGHRSEYEFAWSYLDLDEAAWLEALHLGMVPGPLWLLNPLRRNRLSAQASAVQPTEAGSLGVDVDGLWEWAPDGPPGTTMAGRSLRWTSYPVGAVLSFDPGAGTPVVPGEMITVSVYLRSDSPGPVELRVVYYDRDDVPQRQVVSDRPLSATWRRESLDSITPVPEGIVTARLQIAAPPTQAAFQIAGVQLESGAASTAWQVGGGAARVLVDQLTTSSPRYGYLDCSLTLLEA